MPKYSVVIPALNEEKFLGNILTSLVSQTFRDFEVIVVDGSSKDKTVDLAWSFKNKLPHLEVVISKRASLPLQRNLGASKARAQWFAFVDADVVLLPNFFERVNAYIEEEKPTLFTTWFRPDGETSSDAVFTLLGNLYIEGSIVVKRPVSPGPLTMIKRSLFEQVGGYNDKLEWGEDYDMTKRIVALGIFPQILRETLYVHSLRRLRNEGTLRMVHYYTQAAVMAIIVGRPFHRVSGYVMGGHLYGKKGKPIRTSVLKTYERKLSAQMKNLFK